MKFERILDAYGESCKVIGLLSGTELEYHNVFYRQRDAFRARLVEMYAHSNGTLKGATRQERTVARACDELGIDYVADWNSPTDPDRGER